jgi:2-oxoglutarate dehydrogenase E2 component (dihydrolipoamide succinyltransferase)
MTTEVRVPTLGESVTEATVATWFKKPGDSVSADEMLCELETDKVTVEVPSPASGTLGEIVAAEGETVGVDALLATLTEANGAAAPAPAGGSSDASTKSAAPAAVAQDEMLCELETDKVSVEVPAPTAGVLTEIMAEEGATVQAASQLGVIAGGAAGAAPAAPAEGQTPAAADAAAGKDVANAPSAEKAMAEAGLSAAQVTGTGRDGRIMKEDVAAAIAAAKSAPAAAPASAPAQVRAPVPADDAAREERVKMTRLRQTIAKRLKDSQNTAAMLTTYNEVDMTEVMELRKQYKDQFEKKHGVRLGFMSFFTKACCHALKEVPEVNAEIDGTDIVYKNFVHMGVAAGTPTGLVVPVIRDADSMSFAEIEKAIAEKGKRAREGKLSMAEMQGGTFTISNGGVYGSLMSSPILNPPQSGILGMHKIQDRPVAINGKVEIRPMMYLALSYDHRIVDGKGAVTFLVRVKEALEDPRRLLMDL